MTKLQLFNYVFQFTGFRLARIIDDETEKQSGWGIMGPVLPTSGWNHNYVGWPKIRIQWCC